MTRLDAASTLTRGDPNQEAGRIRVELGNPNPVVCLMDENGGHVGHTPLAGLGGSPAVTYAVVPEGKHEDGSDLYGFDPTADLNRMARHLLSRTDGVSNLPGHEALLAFISPAGLVGHHHSTSPSWVRSDDEQFAEKLAEFYECPVIGMDDTSIEDTHWTLHGPPGVVPGAVLDMTSNITQNGRDIWAGALGGGLVGLNGVSTTAPGATTYTLDGVGAPGSTTAYTGQVIIAGSTAVGAVWANIISNTNAGPPVLTVDRWYNAATPGGAAATTPVAGPWMISYGRPPSVFMGLTANTTTPGTPSTSTSLTAEITTGGGGLIRKICPYAHTPSANTYTLTPVFTANGSDSLPVTIAKIGVFLSMVVADTTFTMMFETLLNATATLSASGDQLTITETVTGT